MTMFRVVRALIVLGTLLSFLPMPAMAAPADEGLLGKGSYLSPQFGYQVGWTPDWSASESETMSNDGGYDNLVLRGPDAVLLVQGQTADTPVVQAVERRMSIDAGDVRDVDAHLDAATPWVQFTKGDTTTRIVGLSIVIDDATVVVVISGRTATFEATVAKATADVTLGDGPVLPKIDARSATPMADASTPVANAVTPEVIGVTPEATPSSSPPSASTPVVTDAEDEGRFEGSTHRYTVTWDPAIWQKGDPVDVDDGDGIELRNDLGTVVVWSTTRYGNDAVGCVDGESEYYSELKTVSDWQPATGRKGDDVRYESDELAYGVFTFTYTEKGSDDEKELVDYIECRPIPGEQATLVFFGTATQEEYNDFFAQARVISEDIEFGKSNGAKPVETPTAEATSKTGFEGSHFTSPTYGYSFDVPASYSIESESFKGQEEEIVLSNGVSTVTVRATDQYTGDLEGCVDFVVDESEHNLKVDKNSEGIELRGEIPAEAYGNFTYTNDDGDKVMYYINCRYIEQGKSMLIVTHDVPYDQFKTERRARSEIEDSIVLPGKD